MNELPSQLASKKNSATRKRPGFPPRLRHQEPAPSRLAQARWLWRVTVALMIVVMATSFLSPPHVPLRSSTARSALLHVQMDASRAAPTVPDFEFPEQPTHSLAVYDTMLKVKPYPNTCPFGDADFAADVQAEELMPSPSSADAAALQKLYSSWLPGASSVLEIVCDGRSRVRARRQCAVTQLHLTPQSYKAGRRNSRKLEHAMWPSAFGADGAELPWAAAEFDLIVCHGCIPYVSAPLHFLEELSRVLAPRLGLGLGLGLSNP